MSAAAEGRRGHFDRAYYQRYYFDPHTAVASRSEMRARARLIAAFTAHAGLPVRRILDAGCGTGLLRATLTRLLPRAHYVALESSDYLCERYGFRHGRIEEYRARLRRQFREAGLGFWLRRGAPLTLWELESK